MGCAKVLSLGVILRIQNLSWVDGAQYHLQQMSSDDQLWHITKHDLRRDGHVSPADFRAYLTLRG